VRPARLRSLAVLATTVCALAGAAVLPVTPAPGSGDPDAAVTEMIRRVVEAPEVTSRMVIERSDPFGGPPDRERGRLWYLPGRGLRYRSDGRGGQDVVLDRELDAFLLYSPSDKVIYRAAFARAPATLRRLVAEPEKVLRTSFRAISERRRVQGVFRSGYRLKRTALGDSLPEVSMWIADDPTSGLPRWLSIVSDADSVLIELPDLTVRGAAKPSDLKLSAPKGTTEEPLDPREFLERGSGESR